MYGRRIGILLVFALAVNGLDHGHDPARFSSRDMTTDDCYAGIRRQSNVAITVLLPLRHSDHRIRWGAGRETFLMATLPNLLRNNPGDFLMFHTDWTIQDLQELDASLTATLKLENIMNRILYPCISPADFKATHEFLPWEKVFQDEDHNIGYRSMCRWYSSRVRLLTLFVYKFQTVLLFHDAVLKSLPSTGIFGSE